MKKLFSVLLFLSIMGTANAGEHSGEVYGFYINSGNLALLKLNATVSDCGDTNWPFTFSMNSSVAQEWASMILMARASGSIIRLGYAANPSGRCTLSYVYFYGQ